MDMFLIVLKQVIIMALLMSVGVVFYKMGKINDSNVKVLSDILIGLVTPCLIIYSFQIKYSKDVMKSFWITSAIALGTEVFSILVVTLVCRRNKKFKEDTKYKIDRISAAFGNSGFMGIPLICAVISHRGVLYASVFIVVLNIFAWTYGVVLITGKKSKKEILKLFTSPPIIGLVIGITLFLCRVSLPDILYRSVGYISDMNTPLSMIVIGVYIAKSNLLSSVKDLSTYKVSFLKLVFFPLCLIVMFMFINPVGEMRNVMIASTIALGCPSAALNTIIAAKYDCNAQHASRLIASTTLLSIITLPFIVFLLDKTMGMFA